MTMATVFDYITWRGDLSFAQDPPNAVDALVDMGVGIHTYNCLPDSRPKALPTLVTERDILDAAEQGKHDLFCASEAVITPAAADRASILNIRILRR